MIARWMDVMDQNEFCFEVINAIIACVVFSTWWNILWFIKTNFLFNVVGYMLFNLMKKIWLCFSTYWKSFVYTFQPIETRAGSLAVRRGFLTLTLPLFPTLSHSLSHSLYLLSLTLSLCHPISLSHSFSLSLSLALSHSFSLTHSFSLSLSLTLKLFHNFLLMTFGTIFILIPKLKSCILTYWHTDILTYWHVDIPIWCFLISFWHSEQLSFW